MTGPEASTKELMDTMRAVAQLAVLLTWQTLRRRQLDLAARTRRRYVRSQPDGWTTAPEEPWK